ncbi:hypothetical protein [Paraglaciecola sp. MB-3u-78]|jgi:hypothetical protein|uniref:hypothetical protein n=1 Tax=Paraglaciecola sp. MB-3u-78 TaxID=2058332 RepID=UPI0018E2B447|nr:hypothetical protein [Paraglaciecola sp. MB-3u-78]
MTVLIILGVLFIALVIIVPLIERSKFRMSNEQMGKLGRWILPLVVIMVIIQLVMHYVN